MAESSLRSIDLHLEYPAGAVVEVDELVDVGAGMYPVYYYRGEERLLVSTSVTALILELGTFERDPTFDPPDFLSQSEHRSMLDRLYPLLPETLRSPIPPVVADRLRDAGLIGGTDSFYTEPTTADRRIAVLRPFERVTPEERVQTFEPTYELDDPVEFVERSAREIRRFVNAIERRFPDHHHVVRVGGRDSQLITLVPKLSDNWHVFSAEPNHDLVREFLDRNGVEVGELFHHDNENEETAEEFRRKVVCGDLRADPRHHRWYPKLEEIVERFDGKCVFWIGTAGDAFNTYMKYHVGEKFFELHLTRAASWLGVTHQVTKNYTGAAALSPYHSEGIWENVYRVHDPGMLTEGTDFRPEIAAQWTDREIQWPDRNPAPAPYEYDGFAEGYQQGYYDYVRACLDGEAEPVVGGGRRLRQTDSVTGR